MATLLRVLNALENIRTSRTMLQRGVKAVENHIAGVSLRRLLLRAQADTEDALNVLAAGGRSQGVRTTLKRALNATQEASDRNGDPDSDPVIVSRVMKIADLLLQTSRLAGEETDVLP